MKFKALIAGIAGSFAISTAAMAADPIFIPPPAPPPPMAVAPAGFDWSGPYAGAGIAVGVFAGAGGDIGITGQFGVNFVRGNAVFGIEGFGLVVPGTPGFGLAAMGKAGFALGATDRILVYGTAGAVFTFPAPVAVFFLAGGGAAIGLGDRLSLFTELLVAGGGGAPVVCCLLRAGVNLHFGN